MISLELWVTIILGVLTVLIAFCRLMIEFARVIEKSRENTTKKSNPVMSESSSKFFQLEKTRLEEAIIKSIQLSEKTSRQLENSLVIVVVITVAS